MLYHINKTLTHRLTVVYIIYLHISLSYLSILSPVLVYLSSVFLYQQNVLGFNTDAS